MAVADFAASGAAHRARLADRVRREVVEVHVALVFELDDAVEPLGVAVEPSVAAVKTCV